LAGGVWELLTSRYVHSERPPKVQRRLYVRIIATTVPLTEYSVGDASQGRTLPNNFVIAVVDDDESVREALAGLMKSLGYRAMVFPSAEDFLNSEGRRSAACLIVDVQMPGMTGPELHDRLTTSGHPIPTILITAYPDERVRARALQAGVMCYLTKPFGESDLLACLRSALDSRTLGKNDT
jgi:FixJ family two-component response regulator